MIISIYNLAGRSKVLSQHGSTQFQLAMERNEAYASTVALKVNAAYEKRILKTPKAAKDNIALNVNEAYETIVRKPVIYEEVLDSTMTTKH